jgi:ribonucleotide reductase alpha subunit
MSSKHYVVKRNGEKEIMLYDKITARMIALANMKPKLKQVDPVEISGSIARDLPPGITTYEIDELAAETAMAKSTDHYEYAILAARIAISNNQKNSPKTFSQCIEKQYYNKNPSTGESASLIDEDIYNYVMQNAKKLDNIIDHSKDFKLDYVGFKTLQRSYLARVDGKIVETWQYLILRTSIGIFMHRDKNKPENEKKFNLEDVAWYYKYRSKLYFTPATPTLFNAGTRSPQMSSCFLLAMKDDR